MERLFPAMHRYDLLRFPDSQGQQYFSEEIRKANAYFSKIGRSGSILGLLSALGAIPLVLAERRGVLQNLLSDIPTYVDGREVYDLWWASFDRGIAWASYLLLFVVGVYLAVLMNIIGARVVLLLYRTRKSVVGIPSVDNIDGYNGWGYAREVLVASYLATTIYGLALTGLMFTLPAGALFAIAPFMIQWIVVLPVYLYIPLSRIRTSIRTFKANEERRLQAELVALSQSDSPQADADRETKAARLERVRRIRELPFRKPADIATGVFTVAASAASIYAALTLWYNLA